VSSYHDDRLARRLSEDEVFRGLYEEAAGKVYDEPEDDDRFACESGRCGVCDACDEMGQQMFETEAER
jgi:hypothetical protein